MKVILAGSRTITDMFLTDLVIAHAGWTPTEIVSGCATGVDTLGEQFACRHGITVKRFPANWSRYGAYAGPKRNGEMARYADALALIWDGKSRGSSDMRRRAGEAGLAFKEIVVPGSEAEVNPIGAAASVWDCDVYRWLSEGGYLLPLSEARSKCVACTCKGCSRA